ncbi:MAG: 3-oxoacid CoA-transferase [Phycisphaerae bacterium]|nr:3-oxoacid CoA-transferase [Phycisphaerae bacterium]
MSRYSAMELMIAVGARSLPDHATVVVGTGAPCAAAMLAQKAHAPHLVVFFEAGAIGSQIPQMPISVGDSRTFHRALMATSMNTVMDTCSRGQIGYTFLGGAQIDPYGNLNSTCIGDWARPKVRFPGSGGANDLASLCRRTLVITPQDSRRFVEKVDFITSPGYLTGKGAREAAGLPADTGPYRVITDLAVMGYDEATCRMKLLSIHEGRSRQDVIDNTGFELLFADTVETTPAPTDEELEILRMQVDPGRYILGRA